MEPVADHSNSTPHGEEHIGTLTLCLPSTFTGGDLVVRHNGRELAFKWADEVKDAVAWGFLYSDCEHEVLPVESGTRLTVAYDVFTTSVRPARNSSSDELASVLKESLADPKFLPEGGTLLFGLQHSYPTERFENKFDFFVKQLKGSDAAWMAALEHAQLDINFACTYDLRDYDDGYDDNSKEPTALAGEAMPEYLAERDQRFLATSGFNCLDYAGEDEGEKEQLRQMKIRTKGTTIWVTEPGAWGGLDSYVTYGNEVSCDGRSLFVNLLTRPARGCDRVHVDRPRGYRP